MSQHAPSGHSRSTLTKNQKFDKQPPRPHQAGIDQHVVALVHAVEDVGDAPQPDAQPVFPPGVVDDIGHDAAVVGTDGLP